MSSVVALKSILTSTNQVLHKIYEEISKLPEDKLIIEWVPSHTGIAGNEKADQLACETFNQPLPQEKSVTVEDATRELKAVIHEEWSGYWRRGICPNCGNIEVK